MNKKMTLGTLGAALAISAITPGIVSATVFTDVNERYQDAVDHVVSKGIKGLNPNHFGVDKEIKRVDAAMFIGKALEVEAKDVSKSTFTDVPSRAVGIVEALKEKSLVNGKTESSFGSNDLITRGEAALILSKAFELEGDDSELDFTDVAPRYKAAVNALVVNGITQGVSDSKFGTENGIKRGDLAIWLLKLSQLDEDTNTGEGEDTNTGKGEDTNTGEGEDGTDEKTPQVSGELVSNIDTVKVDTTKEFSEELLKGLYFKKDGTEESYDILDFSYDWVEQGSLEDGVRSFIALPKGAKGGQVYDLNDPLGKGTYSLYSEEEEIVKGFKPVYVTEAEFIDNKVLQITMNTNSFFTSKELMVGVDGEYYRLDGEVEVAESDVEGLFTHTFTIKSDNDEDFSFYGKTGDILFSLVTDEGQALHDVFFKTETVVNVGPITHTPILPGEVVPVPED